MRAIHLAPLALLLAAAGCRPDPGLPDYSAMDQLFDGGGGVGSLPGPYPYVVGTKRLAFGIFYDGASSDQLDLSDPSHHYYIFSSTYSDEIWADRVEGTTSNRFSIPGSTPGWWGGGIVWDTPTDLTGWTTMHVSFKSSDPGMAEVEVRLLHGPAPAGPITVGLKGTRYGWANDGQWHHLSIPLADFVAAGVNLTRIRGPLGFGSAVGAPLMKSGETLVIDNFYFD